MMCSGAYKMCDSEVGVIMFSFPSFPGVCADHQGRAEGGRSEGVGGEDQ